jgi:hypothetical protein
VTRALAPDRHVLQDARVVADHLEQVAHRQAQHLARRQQDRQRAEGAGHVEMAGDGVGHGKPSAAKRVRQAGRAEPEGA